MNDTQKTTEQLTPIPAAPADALRAATAKPDAPKEAGNAPFAGKGPRGGRGGRREPRPRQERPKSDLDQKTIDVRRVARVVAGGRRFTFRVVVVAGDKNGRVGVGLGKGADTALAVDKALRDARKNMITVKRTTTGSIPHQTEAKYKTARIMLMPAPGRGVVAGSSARIVCELGGIKDIGAKIFSSSKNKLNIARAAVLALSQLHAPRQKAVAKNA